jgi:hypothetical protein
MEYLYGVDRATVYRSRAPAGWADRPRGEGSKAYMASNTNHYLLNSNISLLL